MTYGDLIQTMPWWKPFDEAMNKYFDYWVYVWLSLYYRPYERMGEQATSSICKP